jgi:prolyl oligopeptidase
MSRRYWFVALALVVALAGPARSDEPVQYPQTRRVDHEDVYHAIKVLDPYRWLEEDVRKSPEVASWVAAENKLTFGWLKEIPERDTIRARLLSLWNYERYSSPFKFGGRYFYLKNDGLQNQSVLYSQESLDGKPRVLLDPNQWSKDGTVALAGLAFSDDGKYLAYNVAEAGSDWQSIRVVKIDTGKVLEDKLQWIKFSTPSWTPDDRGFFYSRFEEPKADATFQSLNLNQKIYYHRLGTSQVDDVLVYRRPDHPDWTLHGEVTDDGLYLVITIAKGTAHKYRLAYKDLTEPYGTITDLVEDFQNEYTVLGNDGPVFFVKTDFQAPRDRVIAVDLRKPERANWKEIIPQAKETLSHVNLVGNLFVVTYLKDARTQVKMFTLSGTLVREVQFPGIGSAGGFGGRRNDTETFYTFQSFATPPTIYHYELITGKSTLFRKANVKFNPDDYEVKQVFCQSKDGTRVPMFLTYKKGIQLDGSNPTLLYGYGGFNISLTPAFRVTFLQWMEMGGVYAQANLRGGGEFGEEWHLAGTRAHKQNVFDDFIAAAEWLIANRYTRSDKLAIQGGSNGGLLVGAVETQRPELFGACLPAVGVMDMLRFNQFTAGRFWVDDFGSPQNPEEFKALRAYSPYHNIKDGTRYPPTLITTADHDDRVVPGHSFKFAAAMQHAQAGPAPILIRIETRAGHGAGKPTTKLIEETADEWAFLLKILKMKLPVQSAAGAK